MLRVALVLRSTEVHPVFFDLSPDTSCPTYLLFYMLTFSSPAAIHIAPGAVDGGVWLSAYASGPPGRNLWQSCVSQFVAVVCFAICGSRMFRNLWQSCVSQFVAIVCFARIANPTGFAKP